MFRTKSVYDPVEASDGERILVTRYWPRGMSKERVACSQWLRDLAPSTDLLKAWKAGDISWSDYTRRYREQMSGQEERIRTLASRAAQRTITLLCFEREADPHCHRHLLKKMIDACP